MINIKNCIAGNEGVISDSNPDKLFKKMIEVKGIFKDLSIKHWLNHEVNTWQWWLCVAFIIVPLIIWWKMVDRKRLLEIALYGLLVNTQAAFLDVVGSEFLLWEYPIKLIPIIPRLVPIDLIVIPVVFMLIYQRYPKWKDFLIANTIVSAIFSFIVEPLQVWMGHYKLFAWKHVYSFPIYIAIAVLGKCIINKLLAAKNNNEPTNIS